MMMGSREAAVDYMTPLGLAHLMARGHHYGPGAWQDGGARADWTPPYYHRADAQGIGFDRSAGGSNAVSQYAPALAAVFNDPQQTPEKYLLWFHHLPWDHRMASGATLWDELVMHYTHGVEYVRAHARHLDAACAATWTPSATPTCRRSSPFRKRKPNGGVTPRWPTFKASPAGRFPAGYRAAGAHRSRTTRRWPSRTRRATRAGLRRRSGTEMRRRGISYDSGTIKAGRLK